MKRSLIVLLAFLSLASVVACKDIARMLPASTIDNPAEGTPEFLIYKTIEAGLAPDTEEGWKMLRPYLHSSLTELRTSEDNFLNLNFAAFRRKVRFFTAGKQGTPEDQSPVYKLDYTEEDQPDREHRVFVVSEASDMPSPFRIARDPKANNEWRVKNIP